MTVTFVFVALFVKLSVGEWIHISSTPLYKVNYGNKSTQLFAVPSGIEDYSDEFSCAKVHNLTMMGWGGQSTESYISKGNFLQDLENKLNHQIEYRIRSLGRSSRTYHIGFPSLEGALVSISLLLFAVYLIKLVMKLIHTFSYKRGTTEYVGFLSNIRQPVVIGPKQHRSFDIDMETLKLQALLEEQSRLFP